MEYLCTLSAYETGVGVGVLVGEIPWESIFPGSGMASLRESLSKLEDNILECSEG